MNDEIDLTLHLQTLARRQPSAPALLAPGGKPMTFGSLVVRTERIAARLRQWGFERGDVVAWVNGDRAQTAAALAMLPASATISPLSPSSTISTLSAALRRIGPKAIVVPSKGDSVAARAASLLDIAVMTAEGDDAGEAGAFDLVLAAPRGSLDRRSRHSPAWACIGTTSGATGSPKIVSHGHRQVLQTAHSVGERLGLGPGDISGHVMPLHLAGGIRNALFQSLLCGGAVNCLPEAGVDALIRAIAAGEVTYASAAFTMLREMLARLEEGARYDRGRLRFMRVASGRMEPGEMDRLERALGVPVVTGLASSETGTAAQQAPDAPRKRGSVGRPVASEVASSARRGVTSAPAKWARFTSGARNSSTATSTTTSSMPGRSSTDGSAWAISPASTATESSHLVGRVKEVINRGGDKIAPLEIDEALKRLRRSSTPRRSASLMRGSARKSWRRW
jgi:acyl-CoA synthetase (AMP-forming)/AMP-acid ligase II